MNESTAPHPRGMSRLSFLKSTLAIAGAGLGIAATASSANAVPLKTTCCHSTATNCPGCSGPSLRYLCHSECTDNNFCVCHSDVGANCYSFNC